MADILKGNFQVRQPPKVETKTEDLTDRFEREALKRLGGSIAFVSKKKFLYVGDATSQPEPAVPEPEPDDQD